MSNLPIREGYYRHDVTTDRVRECPMGARACVGGNRTGDTMCADGYDGPLCASCRPGFILGTSRTKCVECGNSSHMLGAVLAPILIVSALAFVAILVMSSDAFAAWVEFAWESSGSHLKILVSGVLARYMLKYR